MPAPPADRADVAAAAAGGARIERRYPVATLRRLSDLLAGEGGEARARLRFFEAADGVPGCEVDVEAEVTLRCQRCLEPFRQTIASSARVAFVPDDASAARAPEGYEAVTAPEGRADLRELVEDELLLSLPIVPRHGPGSACAARTVPDAGAEREAEDQTETQRPFAGLQDLLKH